MAKPTRKRICIITLLVLLVLVAILCVIHRQTLSEVSEEFSNNNGISPVFVNKCDRKHKYKLCGERCVCDKDCYCKM